MSLLDCLTRLVCRFRYPVSLPEDVARDLGISLSNTLAFKELIRLLSSFDVRPAKLRRHMKRELAESMFQSALKKESFKTSSLCSYYFCRGWLVFALYYDEEERLRRVHVQCPASSCMEGFDLHLENELTLATASSQ